MKKANPRTCCSAADPRTPGPDWGLGWGSILGFRISNSIFNIFSILLQLNWNSNYFDSKIILQSINFKVDDQEHSLPAHVGPTFTALLHLQLQRNPADCQPITVRIKRA